MRPDRDVKPSSILATILGTLVYQWFQDLPEDRRARTLAIFSPIIGMLILAGFLTLLYLATILPIALIGIAILWAVLGIHVYGKTGATTSAQKVLHAIVVGLVRTLFYTGIPATLMVILKVAGISF